MATIRRVYYTRPVPPDAVRVTVKGKPAVRFTGADGKPVTAPCVGDGSRCRVPSAKWYGQYKDAAGSAHTVLGKTGDLLVFDATRLMHRGSPPSHKTRSAIDLVFMPRMPNEEMRIMVVGMNHWPADPFFFKMPVDRASGGDLH